MSIVRKICAPFSKNARENADIERRIAEDERLFNEFIENPLIQQYDGTSISNMYEKLMHDAARGEENVPSSGVLTVEQLKVHKRLQKEFLNNLKRLPSRAANIYLKSEIFKINPTMNKAFNEILASNDVANGKTIKGNFVIGEVIDLLKIASNEYEIGSMAHRIQGIRGVTGRDRLIKLNNRYRKIASGEEKFEGRSGKAAAEEFYLKGNEEGKISDKSIDAEGRDVYVDSLDYLTKKGELKVLRDFSLLATSTKKNFKKLMADKSIHRNTKEAAKKFRVLGKERDADILKSIKRLSGLLENSSDVTITSHYKYERVKTALNRFANNIESRMKSEDSGILPILTLDILPQIEGNFYKAFSGDTAKVSQAMDGFLALDSILEKNVYTSRTIKDELNSRVTMDFNIFPLLESYNKNSIKFLHSVENARAYMGAINELAVLKTRRKWQPEYRKEYEQFDNSVDMLNHYMAKLFQRQSSVTDNPLLDRLTRIATNFQFSSKLGINVKTLTKNATQWTFNYFYFGAVGMYDLKQASKVRPNLRTRMEAGRKRSGVFKQNIQETYGDMQMPIEKGPDGNYRLVTGEKLVEKVDVWMNKAAQKSGIPLQAIENQINRNSTYDYAYTKEWLRHENQIGLDNMEARFLKTIRVDKEGKIVKEGGRALTKSKFERLKNDNEGLHSEVFDEVLRKKSTQWEIEFDKYRQRKAQRFADKIVKTLHYDYSQTQKSFAQTSKTGSLVLQFQHYLFSNFLMQKKMVTEGLGDIRSGQLFTPATHRMARLGALYAMVDVISDASGMDLGNLFENAAYNELAMFLGMFYDEEEYTGFMGKEKPGVVGFTKAAINKDLSWDAEEAYKDYWGKGPIAGKMGATYGSMLEIADMIGVNKIIQRNDTLAYITGMKEAAIKDKDESAIEKFTRFINKQIHRTLFRTAPSVLSGDGAANAFGSVAREEFGLYKPKGRTKFVKDIKQGLSEIGDVVTGNPLEHLDYTARTSRANKNIIGTLDYIERMS